MRTERNQLREGVTLTNAALRRIEPGTCGTCPGCGNEMDQTNEARLDTVPTASHCIECA